MTDYKLEIEDALRTAFTKLILAFGMDNQRAVSKITDEATQALTHLIETEKKKARLEEAKLFNRYFDDNQAFKGYAQDRIKELQGEV